MFYVVAYDICEPRRLARVARLLERRATRQQKSVFLFRGGPADAASLLAEVRPLLNERLDCVQAWRLGADESPDGLRLGMPATLNAPFVIVEHGRTVSPETQRT